MRSILIFMLLLTLPASFMLSEEYTCYISGKISGKKIDSVEIYDHGPYYADFENPRKILTSHLNDNGTFFMKVNFDNLNSHDLFLNDYYWISIYLIPKDTISLNIKFYNPQGWPEYTFKGKTAVYNNFNSMFMKNFRKDSVWKNAINGYDYRKYFPYLDSLLAVEKNFYNNYFENVPELYNLKDKLYDQMIYMALYEKVSCLYEKIGSKRYTDHYSYDPDSLLQTQLKNIDIYNFKYPGLSNYRSFITLLSFFYGAYGRLFKNEENTLYLRYKTAINRFTGKARDIAVSSLLIRYIKVMSDEERFKELEGFINKYNEVAKNKELTDYLTQELNECSKFLTGNPVPDFTAFDSKGNKVKLSEFLGKPIYMEFWGTWCSPCYKQIPYMNKLIEKYKGKDIQFVKVAFEFNNNKAWLKYINENHPDGIELYVYGSTRRYLMKLFRSNLIPRFIIIDRNGDIVNFHAKWPDKKELIKDLDKLLSN